MGILSFLFVRKDVAPQIEFDHHLGDDPSDMMPEEPVDPDFILGGLRLGLGYKDESNQKTRRIVRLKRLDASEYTSYLHAFCELRGADRTFIVDRIAVVYDPATGELLGDGLEYFGPHIDRAIDEENLSYERTQYRRAWPIIEALRDELSVLILIGRADNRFTKVERAVILKYAAARVDQLKLPVDDPALVVLADWIQAHDPSEPEVRMALKNLVDRENALQHVWEVAEIIAEADGKVRPQEVRALNEVKDAINALVA